MIKIYTDGSCIGNPGKGGWAAIILENKKQISLALFDLIYMFEKILQSWSDITDLVKPSYK